MNDYENDDEEIVKQIREIVRGGIDEKAPGRVKLAAESKGLYDVARWIDRHIVRYFDHLLKGDFD